MPPLILTPGDIRRDQTGRRDVARARREAALYRALVFTGQDARFGDRPSAMGSLNNFDAIHGSPEDAGVA